MSRHRPQILEAVQRYWGFSTLRPLQEDAVTATLDHRDSLVVLPTGGGKSLCYQVPPLITGRLTVVVSPLIALMKDQVDALRLAGYPAAAFHSNLSQDEVSQVRADIAANKLRLLLVAPERLLTDWFLSTLARHHDQHGIGAFAIDEAHCISQWGHDFRPEYRRLAELRAIFPGVPLNAYTATATPRVREDVIAQLQLKDPVQLVGTFDRPNLTYRILPRIDLVQQVADALRRHDGRAAIVYCITRKDTESLTSDLTALKFRVAAYHAGLDPGVRRKVQDRFRAEQIDCVVATVAFGMGIDRPDVRCVVHAAMPKTVEAYQQETGRAGRDGLPAECVLFYANSDIIRWQQIIERSAAESDADPQAVAQATAVKYELLEHARRLCVSARCRHQALSEYFGQAYAMPNGGCGACDVCLHELLALEGSHEIAQKILSCVYRVGQRFGAAHITDVLRGSRGARILELRHDELSTFGLLKGMPREQVMSCINQLVDQGYLDRTPGAMSVLHLNDRSADVLKSRVQVVFVAPKESLTAGGPAEGTPLTADENELFDSLRALRREIATQLNVPPYAVFADTTLEEMARVRPGSPETFISLKGVGESKLASFGDRFLAHIRDYCTRFNLPLDAALGSRPRRAPSSPVKRPRPAAAAMFAQGRSIADVARDLGVAPNTAASYLSDYILTTRPPSIDTWVEVKTYSAVADAVTKHGDALLRPIFEHLGGSVPYEQIRLVVNHLKTKVQVPPVS